MCRPAAFLWGLALGVLAVAPALTAAPPDAERPNVLILHVDQLRFDCLGACGNPDVKTPNIDRLAADGVRYTNSFCSFPVCTPSRYSLLSGRYVHDHAGWDNRSTLAPEIATFPRIFRAAGYSTKAVGKMHFTPTYLDVGFDELLLAEQDGPGRWDDDYHRYLMRLGLVDRNDLEDQVAEYRRRAPQEYWDRVGAIVSNLPEAYHSTTWIADRAVEAVRSWDSGKRHLLMVGFIKPHHPFDPPAPWHTMYDPQKLTILPGWTEKTPEHDLRFSRGYFPNDELTESSLRRAMAYYYATISQIDHHVGRLTALLKERGLYDGTLIVFTADHGEYLGYHHMLLKGNHMYDPLVKVPLVIKWPGQRRAGQVSERLVSNIDLAPTLCRAAGLTPSAEMPGEDLGADLPGREIVFCEYGPNHAMARTRSQKLILNVKAPQQSLLFDLQADPLEMRNLFESPEAQDEIRRLSEAISAWRPRDMPKRYVDPQAPQIHGPNVPPPGLEHRQPIMDYYRAKMDELQNR
jgi:arylsulfatase